MAWVWKSNRWAGRGARRLRGRPRERHAPAEMGLGGWAVEPKALRWARSVLHPYRLDHPLLYHLAGGETGKGSALAGPEVEALFLAARWVEQAERRKLGERALVRRLDRLDEQLASRMDELEASPDFEFEEAEEEGTEREVGEEELLWRRGGLPRGGEVVAGPPPKPSADRDRWEAGAAEHYRRRGLVLDPDLQRKQWRQSGVRTERGGISAQGWAEIDGRAVRYAQRHPDSLPYPKQTWWDPSTGRIFERGEFPGGPPVLYTDTGRVVPEYQLVPPPVEGQRFPLYWRGREGPTRSVVLEVARAQGIEKRVRELARKHPLLSRDHLRRQVERWGLEYDPVSRSLR